MWTSLEIVKIIVSFSIPLAVAGLGIWFNKRLKFIDQKNEENRQLELEAKENEREELERCHKSRIELTIGANFFSSQEGYYLAEFIVTIYNKSFIQHKFNLLNLSIYGIKKDTKIKPWPKDLQKAYFPEEILSKKSLVPNTEDTKWNYIFVEPGVKQNVTLIIRVPEEIRYVLAHVRFEYDANTPHTAERMFELKEHFNLES